MKTNASQKPKSLTTYVHVVKAVIDTQSGNFYTQLAFLSVSHEF